MDSSKLREEFKKQLAEAEVKAQKAEDELTAMKEYKIKLQGGLETLDLLESPEPPSVDKPQKPE